MTDELDDILDRYDADERATQEAADQAGRDAASFEDNFISWMRSTATPTLQDLAQRLEGRGHQTHIETGTGDAPDIALMVQARGTESRQLAVRFTCRAATQAVDVEAASDVAAGVGGMVEGTEPLPGLSSERVKELATNAIRTILEGWS